MPDPEESVYPADGPYHALYLLILDREGGFPKTSEKHSIRLPQTYISRSGKWDRIFLSKSNNQERTELGLGAHHKVET
jgi:hypothetical protein